MAEFPSPADIFAFAVIFFPGFVSLSIAMRLTNTRAEKLGAVEKVVLSFVLSVASFFVAKVPIDPLAPSKAVLSITNLTLTFLVAAVLGVIVAAMHTVWLYIEIGFLTIADWIRSKLGLTIVPGTALKRALDRFWENRHRNYVVVMNRDGQKFRGFLGVYSIDPVLQVVLSTHNGKNPEKYECGEWKPVDEWALVFTEENIRWVGAVVA